MSFALFGGMYWDTLTCGLWYWALDHTSSYVYSDTGARLLIYREMMCMRVPVILPIILSAVDMVLVCRLACGIGIAGRTRVVLTLTSVLDLLYLKYTLRDLVCWLGLN